MYKEKTTRLVLGEGEVIGHKHVLTSPTNFQFARSNENIQFMLTDMGILTHDEHDRMVLTVGKYRSYNQVEFNPMDSSINRVFD